MAGAHDVAVSPFPCVGAPSVQDDVAGADELIQIVVYRLPTGENGSDVGGQVVATGVFGEVGFQVVGAFE